MKNLTLKKERKKRYRWKARSSGIDYSKRRDEVYKYLEAKKGIEYPYVQI